MSLTRETILPIKQGEFHSAGRGARFLRARLFSIPDEPLVRLIPVLDILNSVVVRGVAGRRELYRPIQSCLTDSVEPLEVARAIRHRYGFDEVYVADLDAIMHERAGHSVYRQLRDDGFRLLVDAGVGDVEQAQRVLETGVERVIVGLESCHSPDLLRGIVEAVSAERIVFSLDLKGGVPLGSSVWSSDAAGIVEVALNCGVRRLIVLDLAGVGAEAGVPTIPLCQRIRATHGPEIEIITGGGVRHADDLRQLEQAGVDGVLVASVLHRADCWLASP